MQGWEETKLRYFFPVCLPGRSLWDGCTPGQMAMALRKPSAVSPWVLEMALLILPFEPRCGHGSLTSPALGDCSIFTGFLKSYFCKQFL